MSLERFFGWMLVHSVWEIAVIAGFLFVAGLFLKRASANTRYLVALAALAACVVLPVGTAIVLDRPVEMTAVRYVADAAPASKVIPVAHLASVPPSAPTLAAPSFSERVEQCLPGVVRLWLLGLIVMCLRLGTSLLAIERLKRSTVPDEEGRWQAIADQIAQRMGIRRPVTLRICRGIEMPSVVGVVKAMVLLPASAITRLSPGQIEALLAHELAHIRRHDYLVNLIQSVVESALFFHPAVWWISSVIRAERENCCDDLAIRDTGSRTAYACALVRLEELNSETPRLAVAAGGGSLLARIQRIAGVPRRGKPLRGAYPASLLLTLALIVLVGVGLVRRVGAQDAASAQSDTVITGRVLTVDGRAAGGATVFCRTFGPKVPVVRVQTSVSDSDGSFKFAIRRGDVIDLTALLKGSGMGHEYFQDKLSDLTIRLARSGPRTVTVLDQNGKPLADELVGPAEINFKGSLLSALPELSKLLETRTDSSGKATFTELPEQGFLTFEADDDRYALVRPGPNGGKDLTVRAEPACRIDVRVLLKGQPVQGAWVNMWSNRDWHFSFATSDGAGEFHFSRFPKGGVTVNAYLSDALAADWVARPVGLTLSAGRVSHAEINLEHGALVEGRVLDADGRPLAKPELHLTREGTPFYGINVRQYMSPDGRFTVRVPSGKYRAVVFNAGVTSEKTFSIENGQSMQLTLRAPVGGVPTVCTLIDADGKPMPHQFIQYSFRDEKGQTTNAGVTADDSGVGTIYLKAAAVPSLRFQVQIGDQICDRELRATNGKATIRLHRVATGSVAGVITDLQGRPLSNVIVGLEFDGASPFVADWKRIGNLERRTGPDGSYRYDGLFSGSSAFIMARRDDLVDAQTHSMKTIAGQIVHVPEIRMQTGSTILGRVLDQNGKPISGAKVFAQDGVRVKDFSVLTDSKGSFRYSRVRPGRHRIGIYKGYDETQAWAYTGHENDFVLKLGTYKAKKGLSQGAVPGEERPQPGGRSRADRSQAARLAAAS